MLHFDGGGGRVQKWCARRLFFFADSILRRGKGIYKSLGRGRAVSDRRVHIRIAMASHQQGVSKSGLNSARVRDLDVAAPRQRLPPRALPDKEWP